MDLIILNLSLQILKALAFLLTKLHTNLNQNRTHSGLIELIRKIILRTSLTFSSPRSH